MILSINGKDPSTTMWRHIQGAGSVLRGFVGEIGALAGSFDSRSRLRRLASIVIRRLLIAKRTPYRQHSSVSRFHSWISSWISPRVSMMPTCIRDN